MKVLSVVDSFKNSLTSLEISKILKEEAFKKNIKLDYLPISDGGDGFLDVISYIINGEFIKVSFEDFEGNKREDSYYIADNIAYVEVARFIGLHLVSYNKRNPQVYGTQVLGKVIKDIYNKGIKKMVIGLGGTATNDFGMGMLSKLGFKFIDGNKEVSNITPIQFSKNIEILVTDEFVYNDLDITIVSDVKNELLGLNGATYTFGIQKGLKENELETIDSTGKNYSNKILSLGYQNTTELPGSGAGGGLGFALTSVFGGKIVSGIDYILNLIDFDFLQSKYDIIITGEGKIDLQSLRGKVVFEVARRTRKKVILICAINQLKDNKIPKELNNIIKIKRIVPELATSKESLENPQKYLRILAKRLFDEI